MMRHNVQGNLTANSMDAFCYEQSDQYDPEYDSGEADYNSMDDLCHEQGDQYDPEYDSGEVDSSLNRRRIVILGPVQLAPKHCDCSRCEWHGDEKPCVQKYVTLKEMNKHYNDRLVSKKIDLESQTLATIGQMQSDFRASMKLKDEQAALLRSQHNAFMARLPKESRAGKERRLQQKQKDFLEKLSNRPVQKAGFKKRIVKDTAVEVVTARRALRRKESRDNKKKEEVERAANFKAVETKTVSQEASVIETVEAKTVEESVVETVEAKTVEESVVETVEAKTVEESVVETVEESVVETVEAKTVEESVVETVEAKTVEDIVVETVEDVWQEVKKPPAKKSEGLPNPTHKRACTQMCRSVGTNEPCRHGNNCRFAHDTSELVFLYCSFGLGCRNVDRQSSGVYKNKAGKTCNHMHPGETKASVCNRAGITYVAPKDMPSTSSKTQQTKTVSSSVGTDKHCRSSHEDEIVITVPKELALQAMEIAMKAGKTNIRIEIV